MSTLTKDDTEVRTPPGRVPLERRAARRLGGWWVPWAFLAPALILFTYFKFIPMGQAFVMSFQDVQPYLGNSWVGWENYQALLETDEFLSAAWHTAVIAVLQTAGAVVVGFGLALLLEGQARRLWFVRSAAFLPVVVPTAVIAPPAAARGRTRRRRRPPSAGRR